MHIVLVTAPPDAADAIAARVVEERLAACVSALPGIRSVYRWRGAVERSEEVQLVMKTGDAALPRLLDRIAALHPYEVPEILAFQPDAAGAAYASWVDSETSADVAR